MTCAKLIGTPAVAPGAAIFFAIGAMFALRCLQPPSGAVALTAVLGGAEIHAAGYGFVLAPVALNSVLLLIAALLYNNATGRRYPHSQQSAAPHHLHQTTDAIPTARLGFTPEDLQAALKRYDQVLDISVDDLEALFQQTEMQAFRRRFGETPCSDIMSRDIVSVGLRHGAGGGLAAHAPAEFARGGTGSGRHPNFTSLIGPQGTPAGSSAAIKRPRCR